MSLNNWLIHHIMYIFISFDIFPSCKIVISVCLSRQHKSPLTHSLNRKQLFMTTEKNKYFFLPLTSFWCIATENRLFCFRLNKKKFFSSKINFLAVCMSMWTFNEKLQIERTTNLSHPNSFFYSFCCLN